MGSVKDLKVLKPATSAELGRGRFIFSDRYSVFDWGEMPDHIPDKGKSLAIVGGYFFEKLKEINIPSHYLGLVEEGEVKSLSQLSQPSEIMEIILVQVIKPEYKEGRYDYRSLKSARGGFLLPLEIIYRNCLPEGSSVFKRLKKGELKPEDLGLKAMPQPGQKLDPPLLDVSTKLEETDRYLSWEEAKEISGLSDEELEQVKKIAQAINQLITQEYEKIGLVNQDGKIELALDLNRNLMVVDVLGTLDECRFTYQDIPVSKEIARIYYRRSEWYQAVEEAKARDRENWKEICRLSPEPLPPRLKELISQVYCATANQITGQEWFKGVGELSEILAEIKEYI